MPTLGLAYTWPYWFNALARCPGYGYPGLGYLGPGYPGYGSICGYSGYGHTGYNSLFRSY